MRALRTFTAGIVATAALVAAGCGGSTSGAGGGNAASLVPASAPVFVSVDTDLSSRQWNTVQDLLNRFPGKDQLLTRLRQSFEKESHGVTWEDVKAALGPELDVAVLNFQQGTNVVGFLQPNDASKFDDVLKKANEDPSSKLYAIDYQGWKVVADSQAKLDAFKQQAGSGAKLADDATFKGAMGKLSVDALLKAYVSGHAIRDALHNFVPNVPVRQLPGQGHWKDIAADAVAVDNGLKLELLVDFDRGYKVEAQPYASTLVKRVPAGVLAFLSFNGAGFDQQLFNASFRARLNSLGPQAQELLGLLRQLLPVFKHENAIYVRTGAPIPEVTLLAQPDNPRQGVAALDRIVARLSALLGAPIAPRPATIPGATAKELNFGRFSIFYGVAGDTLFVTDAAQGISDLQGSGSKLADDPTFKEAADASGLPKTNDGFLYVNLKDLVPFVESLAQLGGARIPPSVSDNLRPLRTLTGYETTSASAATFTLFVEIK